MSDDNISIFTGPDGLIYTAGGDNANCTVSVCPIEASVYGYRPSLAASGTLIALYAICMAVQVVLGWRYKTWGFMTAMLLGCFDEILGYVGRILYWQNPWGETGFIMQIVLITLGPVFFAAAIYVMLTQIIKYISPSHSRFPPNYYYYIFITCDVFSLILQATGGAMSSTSNGASQTGVDIALAGLIFQVITLTAFVTLSLDYAFRSRSVWMAKGLPRRFWNFVAFLSLATILIFIRCAYRIYELSEGYSRDSEALRDEPLFIALESVMIIAAAFCLIGAHPGFVFKNGAGQRSLEEEEKSAEEQTQEQKPTTSETSVSP